MAQISLFDSGLKFKEGKALDEFKDETRERLDNLQWESPEKQTFAYNDDGDMFLTKMRLKLEGIRRLGKKGKFEFLLERHFRYSHLEEVIEDEIPCKRIQDLEACFQGEQILFESDLELPENVLFDGHRYCWRFRKNEDGTISFTEKVIP